MNNRRALYFLLISLALGVVTVAVSARWINQKIASKTTQVVVAAKEIKPGERLEDSSLKLVSWPISSVINGSATEPNKFVGRIALSAMTTGEPVIDSKLAILGAKAGLNAMISQGHRAITVKVNEVAGVAGFALPGNYVDILVNIQEIQKRPISKIVLEKILVLAIAQDQAVRDETKPRIVSAVTLEVTPEQAERLDLARSVGTLSMVLRNQADQKPVRTRGAVIADVLSGPNAPSGSGSSAPGAGSQSGQIIEILRGIQKTTVNAS